MIVSYPKEEKVVNPPITPINRKRRVLEENISMLSEHPPRKPMMKHPSRLTKSVP
jgi:hypothetical protein